MKEIIEAYQRLKSTRKVEALLGIGRKKIQKILKENNIAIDGKNTCKFNNDQIKEMVKLYNNGQSTAQIALKFGCDDEAIRYHLKKKNIERREPGETMLKVPLKLRKKIVDWYLKEDHSSYDISTRLNGENNLIIHPNCVQKFLKREGIVRHGKELRAHICRKIENKGFISKPERYVGKLLEDMGLEYVSQFALEDFNWDFLIRDKILIEVQGDYWHSFPGRMQRDERKYHIAIRNGYKVCYIWEHELMNEDLICNRIKNLFWRPSFDFRSCQCRRIDSKLSASFLDSYHYQRSGRSGVSYGAFSGDELVAVGVFCGVTRVETATKQNVALDEIRELVRSCIHPAYQAANFATWFISRCRKLLRSEFPIIKLLVSFADPNFGHSGIIYKADNWSFDGFSSPSYWYVRKSKMIHKRGVWTRAIKSGVSEGEQASKEKLTKVTARPKLRFIRKP